MDPGILGRPAREFGFFDSIVVPTRTTPISVKRFFLLVSHELPQRPAYVGCQRRHFVTKHCQSEGGCYWQSVCWSVWYLVGSATIVDRVASTYEQLLFIWKSTAFTRGALDRGTHGLPLALNWWTAALYKTRGSTKHHLAGCRTVSSIHISSCTPTRAVANSRAGSYFLQLLQCWCRNWVFSAKVGSLSELMRTNLIVF